MVLVEDPYKYIQPAIPDVPAGTPSILNFISDIRQLETIYTEWPGFILLDPRSFVEEITKLFRGQEYTGFQWDVTTSPVIMHLQTILNQIIQIYGIVFTITSKKKRMDIDH